MRTHHLAPLGHAPLRHAPLRHAAVLCAPLICAGLVVSACAPGHAPVLLNADTGMGIAGFPIGRSVVVEHKVHEGTAISVLAHTWSSVCAIAIPGGGHYVVTLQIRMPRQAWAEARMARVGWGEDADGRDETGYHVFAARPDGRATSESFTHALAGGGTLAFEVNLHPAPGEGHADEQVVPVQLHTIVCKAHRTD